ncbi:MAG: TRAP-type C4-dicarboxylate transport system substrate-binding protein [Gammaproteobacteria bacterium]|jgi:TRAP-type C4-dicarboxylate transport system substrate-binding protein
MTTTIRLAGYQGDRSVHSRAMHVLCDALKGHGVDVQFEQNIVEQGHKASELLARTQSGAIDGCYFSSSYLAERAPNLGLFDQHFVIPSRQHAWALLDGELGARLTDEVAQCAGFEILGYWDNGVRHISARRPIRQPDDCKELAIRTLANDAHQRVFRSLGFEPTTIDVRDLPAAVAEFRVDAQENPLTNTYNFGVHNTHRHITLTGHLFGVAPLLFNKDSVRAWPDAIRNAVNKAIAKATVEQRRMAEEDDVVCARTLLDEGCELITLNDAEREAFVTVTRTAVMAMRENFDAEMFALFERGLARGPR